MEPLATKYRPRTFDDLVGQRAVQEILRRMVANHAVPQAMLFDGIRGTGKTTTARILAAAINCEGNPVPCGHCVSCKSVFGGNSLDLVEIDAASNGLVDDIRALRTQVMYSVGGAFRVVMLDEAHSMSQAAFNALLKTLEEPPPSTVFILLTTEPRKIPDTVLSRCQPFTFTRISVGDIIARLQHIVDIEGLHAEPELLHAIAEHAGGGMRDAVMLLDQMTRVGISTAAGYRDLMGEHDYGPGIVAAITAGDTAAALTAVAEQLVRVGDPQTISNTIADTLRDLMVVKGGGTLAKQGDALTARTTLAGQLATQAIFAVQTVFWDFKTKIRTGDDHRIALDMAVVMASKPFAARREETTAPQARLTLAEMAASKR